MTKKPCLPKFVDIPLYPSEHTKSVKKDADASQWTSRARVTLFSVDDYQFVKMTNDDPMFYYNMGRFFGSTAVRNELGGPMNDNPNYIWIVVFLDNEVVGFGAYETKKNGCSLFHHSYVVPEHRGAGIYAMLVECRLTLIGQCGCSKCVKVTANKNSKALLEEFGFSVTSTRGSFSVMERVL